jgi:two-component system, chemotaxis family, sensor kinase Cph1
MTQVARRSIESMQEAIKDLIFSTGLMPHGYCLAWSPGLVWSMVTADAIIGLSYYSIPVGLLYFVRRQRELKFNWLLVMFSLFIFACGTTHFIDIASIWTPVYRLDALVKIMTATVSLLTAIALWPLVPKISDFIADRQRAFRAVEASNQELEQFAYAVSHDLKSPLRAIGSFAGLLERKYKGRIDADADEYLSYIRSSVAQMNGLIEDLLRLAQVNPSQLDLRMVATADCVKAARELLREEIKESGADLHIGVLPSVAGDERLLVSLFQNLIGNANKFRRPGVKPRIDISAVAQAGSWRFSVRDNGIGIPSEQAGQLFKVFKRLHSRETYPGSGIGLSLCKKIVQLHQGEIGIESTPDAGTTVWFTLPRRLRA